MTNKLMNTVKIFIADNQSFTRAGIIAILSEHYNSHLEIEQIENKEKLFEQLPLKQPHILIIDFNLFNFNSIGELSEIKKISPKLGILVVTNNQSPEDILSVLDCGITNYILKSSGKKELVDAVNATIENQKYFNSEIFDVLLARKAARPKVQPNHGHVTSAEEEIIKLISQGFTTKEIATIKKISYHTVITHRKNIFRKLAISSSSELILYAMRAGIIETPEYYI
jgi:DNA-binding NarL/FixJ family response regulator